MSKDTNHEQLRVWLWDSYQKDLRAATFYSSQGD